MWASRQASSRHVFSGQDARNQWSPRPPMQAHTAVLVRVALFSLFNIRLSVGLERAIWPNTHPRRAGESPPSSHKNSSNRCQYYCVRTRWQDAPPAPGRSSWKLRPGTKRQCRCYRTILSYGKRRYLNGPKQSRHEWIIDNGPMANRQAALILLLLPSASKKQSTGCAPAGQASKLHRCALARPDPRQAPPAESAVLMPPPATLWGHPAKLPGQRGAARGPERSSLISPVRGVLSDWLIRLNRPIE